MPGQSHPSDRKLTVLIFLMVLASSPGCRIKRRDVVVSKERVSKIVFIEKVNACECTKNRTKASLKALKAGLGDKTISIQTIGIDTHPEEAEPYQAMQPVMVIPAIYFLDGAGKLVAQLQGEITKDQVTGILAAADKARPRGSSAKAP